MSAKTIGPGNCPKNVRQTLLTKGHCTVTVFVQSRGAHGSQSQITGTNNGGRGCGVLSGTELTFGSVSKGARVAGRRATARDDMRRVGQRWFVGTVLFVATAAFVLSNCQSPQLLSSSNTPHANYLPNEGGAALSVSIDWVAPTLMG